MGQGTEIQKEVTEKFRTNWDEIFKRIDTVVEKQQTTSEQVQLELDLTNNL